MGTCHSIPMFIESNGNKECLICMENIKGEYVKCSKCKVVLHVECAVHYKVSKKYYLLKCPHCQKYNSSYHYTCDDLHKF